MTHTIYLRQVNNFSMQEKISWMISAHPADKLGALKMYIPEILNSRVPQVG